jgi:hypothetical protein
MNFSAEGEAAPSQHEQCDGSATRNLEDGVLIHGLDFVPVQTFYQAKGSGFQPRQGRHLCRTANSN